MTHNCMCTQKILHQALKHQGFLPQSDAGSKGDCEKAWTKALKGSTAQQFLRSAGGHVKTRSANPDRRLPLQVFPQMKLVTAHLQKVTDKLRESEAREDLKTQANMYFNALSQQVNMRTCVLSPVVHEVLDTQAPARGWATAHTVTSHLFGPPLQRVHTEKPPWLG